LTDTFKRVDGFALTVCLRALAFSPISEESVCGTTDQSYFPFDPRTSQAFPNRSMIDFVFMM